MYFLQNTKRHRYDGMTHNIKVQYFEDKSCITKTCRMLGILNSSNILIQSTTITTTCEQLLVLYAYTCKKLYFCFVLFFCYSENKQRRLNVCLYPHKTHSSVCLPISIYLTLIKITKQIILKVLENIFTYLCLLFPSPEIEEKQLRMEPDKTKVDLQQD